MNVGVLVHKANKSTYLTPLILQTADALMFESMDLMLDNTRFLLQIALILGIST